MTVVVNTAWGGRLSVIVDRQITAQYADGKSLVVDDTSNKLLLVLVSDAIFSISYTGVAVAHRAWMDCQIAELLAHRKLKPALVQPGSSLLARPLYTVVNELKLNMNGRLNQDHRARSKNITVSIIGWHLGDKPKPFAWELRRLPVEKNGNRYFQLRMSNNRIGKFLREHPKGFWGETLGNPGETVDSAAQGLETIEEQLDHDGVERYLAAAIERRSKETPTVSNSALGIQLDPLAPNWHACITYYPANDGPAPFVSPWVLTPRMICSPSSFSSATGRSSDCGNYAIHGFTDENTNLKVQLRLPIKNAQEFEGKLSFTVTNRVPTP